MLHEMYTKIITILKNPFLRFLNLQKSRPKCPGHRHMSTGVRTLWVGDLEEWMNEHWMFSTFAHAGTVTEVKVIRHRPSGCCFCSYKRRIAILTIFLLQANPRVMDLLSSPLRMKPSRLCSAGMGDQCQTIPQVSNLAALH